MSITTLTRKRRQESCARPSTFAFGWRSGAGTTVRWAPHPRWSYQVAFASELFGELVPWLALNRGDLVVFIHPITGDDIADHRDFAVWLGAKLDLDLKALVATDEKGHR